MRTHYRTFERASGQRVDVAFTALVLPSFTEVDIIAATDAATGKPVVLSDAEADDYANHISENHDPYVD